MEDEITVLLTNGDASLTHSRKSLSTIDPLQEPFLYFDEYTELSFEDKSVIFCSLVALVKAEYPFDNALQDRTVRFLKNIEKDSRNKKEANKLVTELVPSSDGSRSGFVESVLTLLSSPHSTVVAAALSFILKATTGSSSIIQSHLVESDLIAKVFATVQPHTLSISRNETMINNLIVIINYFINLAHSWSLIQLRITTAVDTFNHREMIFQKVVLPSSQFVSFLISNRYILNEDLFRSFMFLLSILIRLSLFHCKTLEFVFASPIVMAFSSCLSFVEDVNLLDETLGSIDRSLREWKRESSEVAQSAKRMIQALFSEGFKDTLELMSMNDKGGEYGRSVDDTCQSITQLLGSNVKMPR